MDRGDLVILHLGQQQLHRPHGNGVVQRRQRGGRDGHPPLRHPGLLDGPLGHAFQQIPVLPEVVQVGGEGGDKRRVEFLQHRHHLLAQAVAGVGQVKVGTVLHMGDALLLQVGRNVALRDGQQGADQDPPHRGDACEPIQPGPPDQVEEDGLRIVIGVVGGGQLVGPQILGSLGEETVAHGPGGLLHPFALLLGLLGHIPLADDQGGCSASRTTR